MWVLTEGLWKDNAFPFFNLVTTRAHGNMRDPSARNTLLQKVGILPSALVTAKQVHGTSVATAASKDGGKELDSVDGLITATDGMAVAVFTADCLPVFLASVRGDRKAVGVIHAGWRGLAAGIITRAVEKFKKEFNAKPEELTAAIGPHIQECCYEAGPELKEAFGIRSSATNIDLSQIAVKQLEAAGVRNVSLNGRCTHHENGMFYSHRKDKTEHRIMSLVKFEAWEL
jgi:polyphenol oxidase